MPNETRINLKHLLEDIRDGYTSPVEEVIITELVANALDSGATRVDFIVNEQERSITCVDNGRGMTRAQFREYHNIASSTKERGQGIGFAGVGAKLSLLLADKVVSETKGPHAGRSASEWHLGSPFKAPWKFIPSTDLVGQSRGTAVKVFLNLHQAKLLDSKFIEQSIVKHFYPLLSKEIREKILRFIYKNGIEFYINGRQITLPEDVGRHNDKWFEVRLPKQKKPIGAGFIAVKDIEGSWLDKITGGRPAPLSLSSGLTISTFGKVIKAGWEWVGFTPKSHLTLVGIVEVPALSQLLTTNKDNFLTDSASLKKYYKYRKAIQEGLAPALKYFGEEKAEVPKQAQDLRPLSRQIDGVLENLAGDFPELSSIFGFHRSKVNASESQTKKGERGNEPKLELPESGSASDGSTNDAKETAINTEPNLKGELKKQVKKPGLKIMLVPFAEMEKNLLGRIVEDTARINTSHPAWARASSLHAEEYHAAVTVALLLYDLVEAGKSPQEFVSRFLEKLSIEQKPRTLF